MKTKYSIIIPTLNEEKNLFSLLKQLEFLHGTTKETFEIIVVDGRSEDNTIMVCNKLNVDYILSERGRGIQMNYGANISNGEILIFIHADSILPMNIFEVIKNEFLANDKIATFTLKFDQRGFLYSLYSFFSKFDSIFTTFGDQVIVIRKEYFNVVGNFPNWKIMEDVELLRKVRKDTKIKKFSSKVITSTRRFRKIGIVKTQIKSLIIIIRYLLGASPELLYELYYDLKNENNKRSYYFRKISSSGESKNQVSFINK